MFYPFILCVTLLALFFLGYHVYFDKKKKEEDTTASLNTMDCILSRTSVRSYAARKVEENVLTDILRAGMASPSALNRQPWEFIVITNPEILKKMADALPYAKMVQHAPLAVIVCGDLTKRLEGDAADFWIQDVSAVTQNMLLAAHSFGVGAVWTGVYPVAERVKALQKLFALPPHIVPLNVIPMGYPDGATSPKDKWNPEKIHREKW